MRGPMTQLADELRAIAARLEEIDRASEKRSFFDGVRHEMAVAAVCAVRCYAASIEEAPLL